MGAGESRSISTTTFIGVKALFLWLWFPGLPITSRELYERLKKRGVLIISGHYFFFGHDDETWRHRHECLRMTFTMDERTVRRGEDVTTVGA